MDLYVAGEDIEAGSAVLCAPNGKAYAVFQHQPGHYLGKLWNVCARAFGSRWTPTTKFERTTPDG
jgi:hypothetical protein